MARARRQPPLFEVLHEPARRGGAGGSALSPGTGLRPVQVAPSGHRRDEEPEAAASEIAAAEPEAAERGGGAESRWGSAWGGWGGDWTAGGQKSILLAIAVVMMLVAGTWIIAFKQGEKNEAAKLNLIGEEQPVSPEIADPMLNGGEDRAASATRPASQPATTRPTSTPARPEETARPPAGRWTPGTDPRQAAHNYLVVVTVPFRDAEVMAQFLTEHGVPAAAAPASESVDPKRAMANNDPHVVFPLAGFPSSGFSASAAERSALKAKVEQIGKLWKQAGGYEDFAGAQWDRYK